MSELVAAPSTSSAPGCSAPRSAWPPPRRPRGVAHRHQPRARPHRQRPGRRTAGTRRGRRAADRRRRAARPRRRGRRRGAASAAAVVTDVGSVKGLPLARSRDHGRPRTARPLRRQPPDGRQRALRAAGGDGGAVRRPAVGGDAARALRPRRGRRWSRRWPGSAAPSRCGSRPVEHDRAVARTSHLPHLLAVLAAGQLADAPARAPGAVGPGRPRRHPDRRPATRACGGQIMPGQPGRASSELLRERPGRPGRAAGRGARERRRRRAGGDPRPRRRRHPGDPRQARRARARDRRRCSSRCPTTPASWPGCSPTSGEIGVNIEDLRIDHDPGRPVRPGRADGRRGPPPSRLRAALGTRELGHPPVGLAPAARPVDGSRSSASSRSRRSSSRSWSPWTDPPGRASRAPRAGWRRAWACATSTPAPSSAR